MLFTYPTTRQSSRWLASAPVWQFEVSSPLLVPVSVPLLGTRDDGLTPSNIEIRKRMIAPPPPTAPIGPMEPRRSRTWPGSSGTLSLNDIRNLPASGRDLITPV